MVAWAWLTLAALTGCSLNSMGDLAPCPQGQASCPGGCVALDADPDNCGACGVKCAAGLSCKAAVCATPSACPSDQLMCNGACVDPSTNPAFCGASGDCAGPRAGQACDQGKSCHGGVCDACSMPQTLCGGACVDTKTDATNCGACANVCEPGFACVTGMCAHCTEQQTLCSGNCVDVSTDAGHCGGCGNVCPPGHACHGGACDPCKVEEILCAGACVDTKSDANHCGACGVACVPGHGCKAGICDPCAAAETLCSSGCVDTQTDPLNCGGCGVTCSAGKPCQSGACAPCAGALTLCAGSCVDTTSDPSHCGECLAACTTGHQCHSSVCDACVPGETLCSGQCKDTSMDPAHCGGCGQACATGHACTAGACDPCLPGETLCGGTCVNTNFNPAHCGACDALCPSPVPNGSTVCASGTCTLTCDFGFTDKDTDLATGCEHSEMILWLRADAILGLAEGASVATWPDSSGYGRDATQTSATRQPKYHATYGNGRPALSFDGVSQFLQTPSFSLLPTASSELTLVVLFRTNNLTSQRFLLMQPQSNCVNNIELGYRTGDADRPNFGLHSGCSHATVTTSNLQADTWSLYVTIVESTGSAPDNLAVYSSGTQQALELDKGGWPSAGGYGTAQRKVLIGARDDVNNGSYNSFHSGDIAEVQVYPSALDGPTRSKVEAWLKTKYGL